MTKSFYQDVVSHEQNGISSIEMRHALEAFMDQNQKAFSRVQEVIDKFREQEAIIKDLRKELR